MFEASIDHNNGSSEECKISYSRSEPEVKRCRSLPCRMTPDYLKHELQRYYLNAPIVSRQDNPPVFSSDETADDTNELRGSPYKSGVGGHVTSERNGEENSSSGSDTPESCYIDVEDDTAPSSPLNLSTNDNECHDSKNDIIDDISNSSPISQKKITAIFPKSDETVFHTEPCKNKTDSPIGHISANEISQEKKTNFSIDAILRPDFGVIRSAVQTEDHPHHLNLQAASPHNNPRTKSSAFTPVDLSTRSRSDSLSSPSCSSSSPSPPLSTSSPSPLLKSESKHSGLYSKHYIGQENILLASKLFPEPTKHFHNFLNAHIPFINPLHANGVKTFPFIYSSQNGLSSRLPSIHNSTPTEYRTKPEHEKPTSKFLSRSFYPFAGESNTMLKMSAQQEGHIKTDSGQAFHVLGQNKHRQNSINSLPPSKTEKNQNTNSQSKLAMGVKSSKMTSANCKVELKQEKAGHGDDKAGDSAGNSSNDNALWPAWVFCTRYSDRPSS
ncbi:unnamed protein product, partial [Candidula unifasciata]